MPVALPVLELWSRTAHACYLLFALSRASGRVFHDTDSIY